MQHKPVNIGVPIFTFQQAFYTVWQYTGPDSLCAQAIQHYTGAVHSSRSELINEAEGFQHNWQTEFLGRKIGDKTLAGNMCKTSQQAGKGNTKTVSLHQM